MPMRAAGKYKDAIKRTKSESTLAAEALARAKRVQEQYFLQVMEKRNKEQAAVPTMGNKETERKQQILNLLMGGRKGNAKKFFKAWLVGVDRVKLERKLAERDAAWRRSCNCSVVEHFKGICNCQTLQDPGFQMPFEVDRQRGLDDPGNHVLHAVQSLPDLTRLPGMAPPTVAEGKEAMLPPFLQGKVRAMAHHATGRRCFVDGMYRMVYADNHPVYKSTAPPPPMFSAPVPVVTLQEPESDQDRHEAASRESQDNRVDSQMGRRASRAATAASESRSTPGKAVTPLRSARRASSAGSSSREEAVTRESSQRVRVVFSEADPRIAMTPDSIKTTLSGRRASTAGSSGWRPLSRSNQRAATLGTVRRAPMQRVPSGESGVSSPLPPMVGRWASESSAGDQPVVVRRGRRVSTWSNRMLSLGLTQ